MAITSYPFDSQSTTESQYSQLFRELQDSGVAASQNALDLKVSANGSGMTVFVQPGFAVVRGHAVLSTAVETLTIEAADATARTDRVVLRLDPSLNSIVLAVVKGVAGSGAPALTQTETGIYELPLGLVAVAGNATNIGTSATTDDRRFVGSTVGTWTTAGRPSAPRVGKLGLNQSTSRWEFWNGTSWSDLAPVVTWASITDKPATMPPSTHTHIVPWTEVQDKPATFPPSSHVHPNPQFSDIQNVPGTFPPSAHSHDWAQVTGQPATYPPDSHSHPYAAVSHSHGYAAATHYHSQYLVSSETISWANGTKKAHNNAVGGSGTYYAVWVEGDGTFGRNTSSIKFKKNVRDIEIDPKAVLALNPRVYDRKDAEREDGTIREGRKDEFGLIAEEVHETLPEVIVFDENGDIDAIRYDLLAVALIPVVQEQDRRIARLEELVTELLAR